MNRDLRLVIGDGGLNLDDPDDARLALDACRTTLIEAAADLAQTVKERSDDPLLYALADLVVNSLKLERRIRRLMTAGIAG